MSNQRTPQIIAMGGGGFTMETGKPALDNYILSQCPQTHPHICFLPTASGDHPEYIQAFYAYFSGSPCHATHLALSAPAHTEFENYLLKQDIIYVSGGHTSQMLNQWKQYGIDRILKKAWEAGVMLVGVSAGAACWFEEALTDSVPDRLSGEKCLGFLNGSFCAHYNNPGRRPSYHRSIHSGEISAGIGVDNFAAVHFVGHELTAVVSSRPGTTAYHVRHEAGQVIETPMAPLLLSEEENEV